MSATRIQDTERAHAHTWSSIRARRSAPMLESRPATCHSKAGKATSWLAGPDSLGAAALGAGAEEDARRPLRTASQARSLPLPQPMSRQRKTLGPSGSASKTVSSFGVLGLAVPVLPGTAPHEQHGMAAAAVAATCPGTGAATGLVLGAAGAAGVAGTEEAVALAPLTLLLKTAAVGLRGLGLAALGAGGIATDLRLLRLRETAAERPGDSSSRRSMRSASASSRGEGRKSQRRRRCREERPGGSRSPAAAAASHRDGQSWR